MTISSAVWIQYASSYNRLPVPLVMQSTLCIVLSTQFPGKLGELHLRMLQSNLLRLSVCQNLHYGIEVCPLPINLILDLFSMLQDIRH